MSAGVNDAAFVNLVSSYKVSILSNDSRLLTKILSFSTYDEYPDYSSELDNLDRLFFDFKFKNKPKFIDLFKQLIEGLSNLEKKDQLSSIRNSVEMVNILSKLYQVESNWISIPLMEISNNLKNLTYMFIKKKENDGENVNTIKNLRIDELILNTLQKPFKISISDKSDNKKRYVFFFANLLFNCYLKFNKIDASLNLYKILVNYEKNLNLNVSLSSLIPRSQFTTFNYYVSINSLILNNLTNSLKAIELSFQNCYVHSHTSNQINCLFLLLPLKFLIEKKLPSESIFLEYKELSPLKSIFSAIKFGNLDSFNVELKRLEKLLIKRKVYSLYLRMKPLIILRLFLKTYSIVKKNDNSITNIIPLNYFAIAMNLSMNTDNISVECIENNLANLIYNGYIKGYISHGNKVIVLSKNTPFII